MFFGDDKNKITTVILSKRGKDGGRVAGPAPMKPEISKEEDGSMDGRHPAAEDIIAAFHEKSPQKMMEAMSNFIDIHNSRSEPKMDSEEEEAE